jgi:NAD(P)-dependent dehydrogenase (short-subunit alcohol dehydrogenase family)
MEPFLRGMHAIVTGASRGAGVHIAARLWQAGASLLLVARSERVFARCRELQRSARGGQQVHGCVADLADPAAPERIMAEARRRWSRLDGLVNNAAIQGPIGPLWENDFSEWTRVLQVNLLAPVALCRLAVPWMRESGGGSIVNLSGGGAAAPRPNFTAYATSKAALVRFSETLARETELFGIRVNCVAPGALNTDMLEEVLAAGPDRAGAEYAQAVRRAAAGGDPPERAAELVAFLLSERSAGITGRLLSAIWDPWPSLAERREELAGSDIYTLRRIGPADRGKEWS